MATLEQTITQVKTYLASLSGIRTALDKPPERIATFPTVIVRPGTGTWEIAPSESKRGLHNIVIELHVARKDLPRDIDTVFPYVESIPNLLMYKLLNDSKWNGAIDTFRNITYRFMTWAWEPELTTVGIEFTINDIKIQSALSA